MTIQSIQLRKRFSGYFERGGKYKSTHSVAVVDECAIPYGYLCGKFVELSNVSLKV